MSDYRVIYSAMKTPDGTLLVSRNRHDYVTHTDANGKHYMLDGGTAYIRSSMNGDEEFITVCVEDGHNLVREHMEWGTYGKNGDQPLRYVKLKDMETGHIEAILETQSHISSGYRESFENELEYRKNVV